jgi:mono/diheme cytochrome c family protein
MLVRAVPAFVLVVAIGCGGSTKSPETAATTAPDESVDPTWNPKEEDAEKADESKPEDQVRLGATLFTARCTKCHGDNGEGKGDKPALIGPKALPEAPREEAKVRTESLGTAQDLHDFILAQMPPGDGKLGDEEAWAVTAYLASANDIQVGVILDAESGSGVSLARAAEQDDESDSE